MAVHVPDQEENTAEVYYPEADGLPMAESDQTRDLMIDCIQTLNHYFADQDDVYVSGNLLIYYQEGDPFRSISPDVFVARGVPKGDRHIYQTWVEGKMPDVVIEIVSETTWHRDLGIKATRYHTLGVQEYFLFDHTGQRFGQSSLLGMSRDEPGFREIEPDAQGRLRSELLNLLLGAEGEALRFYHPDTGERLMSATERAAEAEIRASEAHERAVAAEERLQQLEAEVKRLRDRSS